MKKNSCKKLKLAFCLTVMVFLVYAIPSLYKDFLDYLSKPKLGYDKISFLDDLDLTTLRKGSEEMKKHKVIFTGITRDNARDIPTMLQAFRNIGEKFADFRVVIFENDSSDDTLKLLKEAAVADNRFKVISQNYNLQKRPSIKFLAEIRNKYLEAIFTEEYDDFDIVIMADMDMKYGIDIRGIEHSFAFYDKWDSVCSNGIFTEEGRMWDCFAFRSEEFPCGLNDMPSKEYWESYIYQLAKVYPVNTDLLPVHSCFGGLAIYKKRFIEGCKYDSENEDCEHVAFKKCMREKNGARIFMNPSQMLRYEHYGAKYLKQ